MNTLLRRRIMMGLGGSPTPPTPTYIAYIRNDGRAAYIDTGITPDNTTRVIVWARNFNPNTNFLFGSRSAFGQNSFAINANVGVDSCRITQHYANQVLTPSNGDVVRFLSNYHKYELDNNKLIIDDTLIQTLTSSTFSNNYNIHLFGLNNGGTHAGSSYPIDVCAVKIYKNGSLVRDYTPVQSPSVGLYDAISGTVFTNANNSGNFSYGTFEKDAYIPLEYIQSDGNQYFDTGILGTQALPFVVKFIPNVPAGYSQLFGVRTSSSSKRFELSFGDTTVAGRYFTSAYNTSAKNYNNTSSLNNSTYISVKSSNVVTLYLDSSTMTTKTTLTHTSATFTTDHNIYAFALNNNNTSVPNKFVGKVYILSFGGSRNFVPAMVDNVAGMWDTYGDVFYPSLTETSFIAGNEL